MRLTIDAGNTRIKYAVFENDAIIDSGFCSKPALQANVEAVLTRHPDISDVIAVSVGTITKETLSFISSARVHIVETGDDFPFANDYATPSTLGTDRMVLAAGAVLRFPGRDRLVIDVGTCVTYDFISASGHYLGGAISPGIRLRYESLHRFTQKLPLLKTAGPDYFIGSSTADSIHSGVVNGLVNEIDGFIGNYREHYPNFIIILTGGDTEFLSNRLKNTIFANSNFLLESLNLFFQYKTDK